MNNSDLRDTGLTRSLQTYSALANAHKRMLYMNTQQQHRQQGHTLAKIHTVEKTFTKVPYATVKGSCFGFCTKSMFSWKKGCTDL